MAEALFPALNEISSLLEKYPQAAASAGKQVVGWFCSYTPLEIFHAAGLYPYRIIPEPGRNITRADGFIDRNFCPYVRTCLAGALDGEYDFLRGLVVVNSCDPMRRMHDVWRYNIGGDFNHLLDLPRVNSPEAVGYFRENLQKLVAEIETHFNVKITGAALTEAIKLLNTGRALLKELYRLNAEKGGPVAAADVRTVIKAGAALPADVFNALLERLLSEMRDYDARRDECPRILITGSVMDNPMIPRLIEECGARVVADDLCNGTRQFWDAGRNLRRPPDGLEPPLPRPHAVPAHEGRAAPVRPCYAAD